MQEVLGSVGQVPLVNHSNSSTLPFVKHYIGGISLAIQFV